MANEAVNQTAGINALSANAAYNLANVTKTKPQYGALTPKWLTKILEFKGLETGIYRVNKVVEGDTPLDVLCSQTKKSDIKISADTIRLDGYTKLGDFEGLKGKVNDLITGRLHASRLQGTTLVGGTCSFGNTTISGSLHWGGGTVSKKYITINGTTYTLLGLG